MRVFFMGTPEFACAPLRAIIGDGHELCGVFTRADKPQGRGMKLSPPPVKVAAAENGIPVWQPLKLRDGWAEELIRSLAPEVIVVVAYGRLLPPALLALPPAGCINIHASLLPKYRGAAPIQRAVAAGETETGVTTMFMAEELDAGDMILQKKIPVGPEDTAGQTHDSLMALGAELIVETLKLLEEGTAPRVAQEHEKATFAPVLTKDDGIIDWSRPAAELHNLIRGMQPWPVAHCGELKVHSSRLTGEEASNPAGTMLPGGEVVCGDGKTLKLLEVQAAGKRRMTIEEYLRGRTSDGCFVL